MILLEILNALLQFTVILMHARAWKHAPQIFFCNLTTVRINCFQSKGSNVGVCQQIIMNEETTYNFKALKVQNILK